MALFAIPLTVVVEASTPAAAEQQAQKAKQLLTDPMTMAMMRMQGLALTRAIVGKPTPTT